MCNALIDGGYDGNAQAEAFEYHPDGRRRRARARGSRRGRARAGPLRHYICPLQARGNKPAVGRTPRRGQRERLRAHRAARERFYRSARGRRLYAWRGRTVEPFNQWFKHLFDLEDRVWHRGLDNNRTMLLAAIFCYQTLLRYAFARGRRDGQIQWILDGL